MIFEHFFVSHASDKWAVMTINKTIRVKKMLAIVETAKVRRWKEIMQIKIDWYNHRKQHKITEIIN